MWWPAPLPTERFLYLLLYAIHCELRYFRDMLRVTWIKQRAATVIFGAVVAFGLFWWLECHVMAGMRDGEYSR